MNSECLTIAVGIATIMNAGALIYDVCRRNKKQSATFVQVPNRNEGGVDEFRTEKSEYKQGSVVERILINSDGTVEIKRLQQQVEAYGRFIKWRS